MPANHKQILIDVSKLFEPAVNITVAESAEQYLRMGVNATQWTPYTTPYMVKPMNTLMSREYDTECFIGPARTGKTVALANGWLCHIIKHAPNDVLMVHSTKDMARSYSMEEVDRIFLNQPDMRQEIALGTQDDNKFDKTMRNGMIVSIVWPTSSQLASRTRRYVIMMDFDRGKEQVEEGGKFQQAKKRTQTFLSAGMTCVETSPGRVWADPKWVQTSPHELPPATGGVRIYNSGTRERFYWKCKDCQEWYIPSVEHLIYDEQLSRIKDIVETVRYECPHCAATMGHAEKYQQNLKGTWLAEGLEIGKDDHITGEAKESNVASFHIDGAVAAYQSWADIIRNKVLAEREYENTGDEDPLQDWWQSDVGMPYKPKIQYTLRSEHALQERSQLWEKYQVPEGVRFLITTVDVQIDRFVVMTTGFGRDMERWVIDYYSLRHIGKGDDKRTIDPAANEGDWQLLTQLRTRHYELTPTKRIAPCLIMIDSGGAAGATNNAYNFWRQRALKNQGNLYLLLKGGSVLSAPRVKMTYPDNSQNSQRKVNARGEVPVLSINVNMLKDELDAHLRLTKMGANYYHMPSWLPKHWFQGMTKEVRDDRTKKWSTNMKGNEPWDLSVYAAAGYLHLQAHRMNWDMPFPFAAPHDAGINPYVFDNKFAATLKDDEPMQQPKPKKQSQRAPSGAGSWF